MENITRAEYVEFLTNIIGLTVEETERLATDFFAA